MTYSSINPSTEHRIQSFSFTSSTQLKEVSQQLMRTFFETRLESIEQRIDRIVLLKQLFIPHRERFARCISSEMGKPYRQSINEIDKCIGLCDYYIDHGLSLLQAYQSDSQYIEPLGVILAIMPWNYPLWQIFRVLIPQLFIGNVILFKPALNTAGVTELLAETLSSIESVSFLRLSNDQVSHLIQESMIAGVTLTGSVAAGRQVGALSAAALKPCVLELGGSDPFIVCEDADIQQAAIACMQSRFGNSGQSCIAAKRLIVHDSVVDLFLSFCSEYLTTLVIGDPLDDHTTMGPLARHDLMIQFNDMVYRAEQEGALLYDAFSGALPSSGFFVRPAIYKCPDISNVLWTEETFGPVLPVMTFNDDITAVELANHTSFGLGGSVWSGSQSRIDYFLTHIHTGMIAVNQMMVSVFNQPFGGIKQSGYGKELAGEGLVSFANIKQVLTS